MRIWHAKQNDVAAAERQAQAAIAQGANSTRVGIPMFERPQDRALVDAYAARDAALVRAQSIARTSTPLLPSDVQAQLTKLAQVGLVDDGNGNAIHAPIPAAQLNAAQQVLTTAISNEKAASLVAEQPARYSSQPPSAVASVPAPDVAQASTFSAPAASSQPTGSDADYDRLKQAYETQRSALLANIA